MPFDGEPGAIASAEQHGLGLCSGRHTPEYHLYTKACNRLGQSILIHTQEGAVMCSIAVGKSLSIHPLILIDENKKSKCFRVCVLCCVCMNERPAWWMHPAIAWPPI